MQKGESCGHLKKRRMQIIRQHRTQSCEECFDPTLWNHLTVDANAFTKVDKMGGRIQPDTSTGAVKDRRCHRSRGSFAVRASDMEDLKRRLWTTHSIQ